MHHFLLHLELNVEEARHQIQPDTEEVQETQIGKKRIFKLCTKNAIKERVPKYTLIRNL